MNYWLLKSEPDIFSLNDLFKSKNKSTCWEGVRNYQARNYIREMKIGDLSIFYHSNCTPACAAGICEIVKEGYPDFTAFDPDDVHYDSKSRKESPTWLMVDVKFVKKFNTPVTLSNMKENKRLRDMQLLQLGNRLSVMSITKEEFEEIVRMGL